MVEIKDWLKVYITYTLKCKHAGSKYTETQLRTSELH